MYDEVVNLHFVAASDGDALRLIMLSGRKYVS